MDSFIGVSTILSVIIPLLIIILAIIFVYKGVKVVPQSKVYVIERFGKYLKTLKENLLEMENETDPEKIQTIIYDIGMNSHFESLKDWFSALYEILLGQTQGPRLGSFIILYGVKEVIDLIDKAIEGKL